MTTTHSARVSFGGLAAWGQDRPAIWPLVMIVALCCLSVLADAIVLTALNGILLLAALVVVVGANQRVDPRLWHVLIPFALILATGLVSGVGAERYDYLKDAWYVSNPAVVMLSGYVLYKARPDLAGGLKAFVIAGLLVALWQSRGYLVNPGLILLPAVAIRERIGTGLFPPLLALVVFIVLAGAWRERLRMPGLVAAGAALLAALSVAGTFSRTALLVAVVAFTARVGGFARQEWLRLGLPGAIAVTIILLAESLFGRMGGLDLQTFLGKLVNGLREITFTDTSSIREINTNFRGFESAQALKQVMAGTPAQIFFGQGFGALVDLGVFIPLGGFEGGMPVAVRRIPVLHNGYMYLLVKGGVVALLLYLYVLGYLYRVGRSWATSAHESRRLTGRLIQAMTVCLLVTTYLIGGVFNKHDMFAFMLCTGYLLAAMDQADEKTS